MGPKRLPRRFFVFEHPLKGRLGSHFGHLFRPFSGPRGPRVRSGRGSKKRRGMEDAENASKTRPRGLQEASGGLLGASCPPGTGENCNLA